MSKCAGVTELGDDTKMNAGPIAHLALRGEHARLELVQRAVHEIGVFGVLLHVEQRQPRIGRCRDPG